MVPTAPAGCRHDSLPVRALREPVELRESSLGSSQHSAPPVVRSWALLFSGYNADAGRTTRYQIHVCPRLRSLTRCTTSSPALRPAVTIRSRVR